uniref:Ig-like domain-containing protein n=1 Tax=Xenopus tropicalis TaxID=8364 RepID=A0A1B8XYE8_XENTR
MGYEARLLRGISLPLVTWLEKCIMGYEAWLLRGISLPLVTGLEKGIMGYEAWLLRGISLPLVTGLEKGIMGYEAWLLRGISLPLVTWLEKGIMGYEAWLLRGISLPLVTWLEKGIMGYEAWLLRGISLPLVTWLGKGIMGYEAWLLRGLSLPLVTCHMFHTSQHLKNEKRDKRILPTDALLKIGDEEPPTATLGSDVILPCTFSVGQPVSLQYLAILWTFQNKMLFRLDNKGKQLSPRVTFSDADAMKGIASVQLHNVSVADAGIYMCKIIYSPEKKEKDITLKVQCKNLFF